MEPLVSLRDPNWTLICQYHQALDENLDVVEPRRHCLNVELSREDLKQREHLELRKGGLQHIEYWAPGSQLVDHRLQRSPRIIHVEVTVPVHQGSDLRLWERHDLIPPKIPQ